MTRHYSEAPRAGTTAYHASEVIFRNGPMTIAALFTIVPFASRYESKRRELLDRWAASGWFEYDADKVLLTQRAYDYLDGKVEDEPVFVGTPATSCTFNMLTRPPYKTPRAYRRENPEWAKRPEGFGFVTISGVAL